MDVASGEPAAVGVIDEIEAEREQRPGQPEYRRVHWCVDLVGSDDLGDDLVEQRADSRVDVHAVLVEAGSGADCGECVDRRAQRIAAAISG